MCICTCTYPCGPWTSQVGPKYFSRFFFKKQLHALIVMHIALRWTGSQRCLLKQTIQSVQARCLWSVLLCYFLGYTMCFYLCFEEVMTLRRVSDNKTQLFLLPYVPFQVSRSRKSSETPTEEGQEQRARGIRFLVWPAFNLQQYDPSTCSSLLHRR